jgi:hypothetical protein
MEQIMGMARKMSDGDLADVLSGKNMQVPQFVALSEAMGRKQLRMAMQGAQAQQQVQQPSIKDQMLAETQGMPPMMPMQGAVPAQAMLPEEQGIGALPAPNMEGMAGGGIVAFDDGGDVKNPYSQLEEQAKKDREAALNFLKKSGATVADTLMLAPQAVGSGSSLVARGLRALGVPVPPPPSWSTLEGYGQFGKELDEKEAAAQAEAQAQAQAAAQTADETAAAPQPVPAPQAGPQAGPQPAPQPAAPVQDPVEQEPDRFAQFETSGADLEAALGEQKQQTQGAFLMQIGASLLTSPTIAEGLGKGAQAALPMLVSNQREAKKLQQDSRDFRFNLEKAREAADMGKEELALKYQDTASQIAYRAGVLATKGTERGLSQKNLADMFQRAKTEALKAPGASLKYSQMDDSQKAAFDRSIMDQVMSTVNALTGGGAGTGTPSAGVDRDAIMRELARRGVGE